MSEKGEKVVICICFWLLESFQLRNIVLICLFYFAVVAFFFFFFRSGCSRCWVFLKTDTGSGGFLGFWKGKGRKRDGRVHAMRCDGGLGVGKLQTIESWGTRIGGGRVGV